MKKLSACALLLTPLMFAACGKKAADAPPPPVVVAPAAPSAPVAAPVDPDNMSDEQRDIAKKKAKLDFATREDTFIQDTRAQWAASATASSTYKDGASEHYLASNATGAIDDNEWTNAKEDIGFDWLELSYAKPVNATEVRLVTDDDEATESLTKVELQDTDGKWNEIWAGISDTKPEKNGPRTWIVKTFPKTAYKVKAVKYTFANNVSKGLKEVEAAQLVGD